MDNANLERIVLDPEVLAGKPVVRGRGTRLSVAYIVGLLAAGASVEEVLGEYEGLSREDVLACLHYAKRSLEATDVRPLTLKSA